jgi:hypothetical protein
LAVLFADIVYGTDVWVVQRRGGLRFSLEARQGLRVIHKLCRQKLERNKATEPSVLGFVNDTHTATTELFYDSIVRNGLA